MGSLCQDSVQAGTFWGFLNTSLHATAAQQGLNVVDEMYSLGWDHGALLCFGVDTRKAHFIYFPPSQVKMDATWLKNDTQKFSAL